MKVNFINLFVFAKKIQIIKLINLSIVASIITSLNEAAIMYLSQILVYKISGNNIEMGSFNNENLIYFSSFPYEFLGLFFYNSGINSICYYLSKWIFF